jgi:nucleotide-binding universal stress UspA family protein
MEGVVIGVDESASARSALRWGVEHAGLHDRPVTVLMAWSHRDQHHLDPAAPFEPVYGREQAERDLDAIVERALGSPCPWPHRRAMCGSPGAELLRASAGADLVVIGARGMGGFKGLLLGSVSRAVLHASAAPVAVVRTGASDPHGPIVVGVDGSATARRGLRGAIDEAGVRGCPVVAIHTWHISATGEGYIGAHMDAASMAETAERMLEREVAGCERAVMPVERRVEVGFPAAVLVEASQTASMVVVGSRGHRTATGLLLGSVSEQVTHHASGPVVVVPPGPVDVLDR